MRKGGNNIRNCCEEKTNGWSVLYSPGPEERPIPGSLESDNDPPASINNAGIYWLI